MSILNNVKLRVTPTISSHTKVRGKPTAILAIIAKHLIRFYNKTVGSQESGDYPIPVFKCTLQTKKKKNTF